MLLTFGKMESPRHEVVESCRVWLERELEIRSSGG